MATLTHDQEETRSRVEGLIRLMAPALDAILAVGDRISRAVEPEDHEYYPVRPAGGDARSPLGADPGAPPPGA